MIKMASYKYSQVFLFMMMIITNFLLIQPTQAQDCSPSGTLTGTEAPPGSCDPNTADCCEAWVNYPTFTCSPPVTGQTDAMLTFKSFPSDEDGVVNGAVACDLDSFVSSDGLIVALSTGWFNGGSRCNNMVVVSGNGLSVAALVVDVCDSTTGCDAVHGYVPPCGDNVVVGSQAVWDALGVSPDNPLFGYMSITWSDA